MKKQKKVIIIVLSALLLAAALSSCTKKKPEQDDWETAESVDWGETAVKTYTFNGVKVTIPADWTETLLQNVDSLVMQTYPDPSDNITFVLTNGKTTPSVFTEEALRKQLEPSYESQLGVKIGKIDRKPVRIPGAETVRFGFSYTVGDTTFHQTIVVVFFSDRTVSVTFTEVGDTYHETIQKILNSMEAG